MTFFRITGWHLIKVIGANEEVGRLAPQEAGDGRRLAASPVQEVLPSQQQGEQWTEHRWDGKRRSSRYYMPTMCQLRL